MGTILRAGMDDGKGMGSWHMPKGKGKGTGRRPVPLGPRPHMPPTVPPRPKLMPTSVRHGGAWMQCFLWVPFQPGASPAMPPPVSPCGPPPPPPPQTSAPTTPAPTAAAEAGVPEGTGPAAWEEIGHTGPLELPTEEEDNDYAEEDCGSQTCVFELFFFGSMLFMCCAHLQCSRWMLIARQILAILLCIQKLKKGMRNPTALGL